MRTSNPCWPTLYETTSSDPQKVIQSISCSTFSGAFWNTAAETNCPAPSTWGRVTSRSRQRSPTEDVHRRAPPPQLSAFQILLWAILLTLQ